MGARPLTLFGDVARWFADPANWQGSHGIPTRILEHLELSGLAVAVAIVLAMPIALYLGHGRRGGFIAINVANIGRALPSLALLAFGLIVAIALGRFIVDGFALREYDQLVGGAILVALLAVATEVSFSALERRTAVPGMAAIR